MPELLQLPAMAQDEHAYDLVSLPDALTYVYPGHGNRPGRSLTLGELADEAVQSSDGQFDLVGVALGGIVAQQILVRHGGRVRSAVLANTPGGVSEREPLLRRADETAAHGVDADELLKRWLRPATIAAGGPAVEYLVRCLRSIDPVGLAHVQRAMADHDVLEALTGDTHPVTFVVGEDDHVGVGSTERLAQRFTTFRIRRIPGGHMVHLDNPTGFRAVVEEHLQWVEELDAFTRTDMRGRTR